MTADQPKGQLLIYQDGALNLQVRLDGNTVWLTQKQLADLYQVSVPAISQHITSIFEEGELPPEATVKQYLTVQTEGSRQVQRAPKRTIGPKGAVPPAQGEALGTSRTSAATALKGPLTRRIVNGPFRADIPGGSQYPRLRLRLTDPAFQAVTPEASRRLNPPAFTPWALRVNARGMA